MERMHNDDINQLKLSHTGHLVPLYESTTTKSDKILMNGGTLSFNNTDTQLKTESCENTSAEQTCQCGVSDGYTEHLCMERNTFHLSTQPTNDQSHSLDRRNTWHCHAIFKPKPDNLARNQLIAVSVLCLIFMIGEAIGGVLSNSLALFTDVLHLASDMVSFLLSLLAIYLSSKPHTNKFSFGYHRAEVVGALFSVFIIWLITGILFYMAVERIIQQHYKDVKPDEMLITAMLGVVFNVIMGFVLHSEMCCGSASSYGHGHTHSHKPQSDISYQKLLTEDEHAYNDVSSKPRRHKNLNVRAAFIHVLGDIIQSIGVLIAAIIIKLRPEELYRLADPICTFIFSLLVLATTITVLKDTLHVIMEGVPCDMSYHEVQQDLLQVQGVNSVHNLCVWALTLDRNVLTVHLVVDMSASHQKVLEDSSIMLKEKYKLYHTVVQIEDDLFDIMEACKECNGPKSLS